MTVNLPVSCSTISCPQHQTNLTGADRVIGNRFAAFDTAESRFLDDVRAWPSVEPAIDFTATGMLALTLTAGSC